MEQREKELRRRISELVAEVYQLRHARKSFVPGETVIPYAGRVFDEREMQSLIESSLDFWLTLGPYGKTFEKKLAEYIAVRFAVLANSGSSANLLAFAALTSPLLKDRRILPGSEVITLAAGFPTTVNPILQFNCVPVFVDITPDTKNIDVKEMEKALSAKTRAVMIAHTLGNPFDLDAVTTFCRKHKLFLIEDNCDALGSEYRGQKTGSFGDVATISFYPPHHITMGEGGAVLTKDAVIKRAIESFRDWGRDCWCDSGKDNTCGKRFDAQYGELPHGYDHKYVYSHIGYNLKPLDLQAAIGCEQLEKLPSFVEARRRNFDRFYHELKRYDSFFVLPEATAHSRPSWFGFPLTVKAGVGFGRAEIVNFLEQKKIQTRMLFGGNLTKQPYFTELKKEPGRFRVVGNLANTDKIMNDTFWFGVYPGLSDTQMDYMMDCFHQFMKKHASKNKAGSSK